MRRSLRPYSLVVLVCLLVPLALAADTTPWYQVELIVFARPNASGSGEAWPRDTPPPVGRGLAAWTGFAGDATVPFQRLPEQQLKLNWEYTRLKGDVKPLLHMGWLQPGLDRNNAVAVRVRAEGGAGVVDGTVRVVLSRYLHMETNLAYVRPGEAHLPAGARSVFVMKESRRMRSREFHYLDNPLFGVIAVITPYPGGKGG